MGTNKGFTGQYSDAVSGLDYYISRYYDPVAGVFLSADKAQGNMQSLNPYSYVGENPETRTDPMGEMYACGQGCGGGTGGPSAQQINNDATAYTHHTTPAGGYLNTTLPPLLYMFLYAYAHRSWSALEGAAQNNGYSLLPELSQQAFEYLHFTSDTNWNANNDTRAYFAKLTLLSVMHLVRTVGDFGPAGTADSLEISLDQLAAEDNGAFIASTEDANGAVSEDGSGSGSKAEGGCSFTPVT